MREDFSYLKPGDPVSRRLGKANMELIVGKVDNSLIHTASADGVISLEEGWKFRVENGAEVDEDLGWDGINKTGSYLLHPHES